MEFRRTKLFFTRFLFIIFLTTIVLSLRFNFFGPGSEVEHGTYLAYLRSIFHDLDFNIVNNLDEKQAWFVSTSYNYPSMHDFGVATFWYPIYSIANWLQFPPLVWKIGLIQWDHLASFSISLSLFLLLSWELYRFGVKSIGDKMISFSAVAVSVISTGFYYWSIFEYSGTETILAFLNFIYLKLIIYRQIDKSNYIKRGIILGLGRAIKIHFSYLLLVEIISFFRRKNKEIRPYFYFLLVLASIFLMIGVTNFIKFGEIVPGQGYFSELSLNNLIRPYDFYLSFWGNFGFVKTSPIYLICLPITLLSIYSYFFKQSNDPLIALITFGSFSVLLKFAYLISVTTPFACEFGARNFMIDIPFIFGCTLLAFQSITKFFNKYKNIFLLSITTILIVNTFVHNLWYLFLEDLIPDQRLVVRPIEWSIISRYFILFSKNIANSILEVPIFYSNNLPLILILSLIIYLFQTNWIKNKLKQYSHHVLSFYAILFVFLNILNFYFNAKNAEHMKAQNFFSQKVIGNGQHLFTLDNTVTDIIPVMELDKKIGRRDNFEFRKKFFQNHLVHASQEIVQDNFGFFKKLEAGKLYVGIYGEDVPLSLLEWETPSRF